MPFAYPLYSSVTAHHLEFIGPDGKERLPYRANVACGVAGGRFALPLALNDMAGTWTIRVHEVATGLTTTAGVRSSR